MDEELEKQLVEQFPDLFRFYGEPPAPNDENLPPITHFGIQCGSGWYEIIKSYCVMLKGGKIVDEAYHYQGVAEDADMYFSQIKEKFGGIRLYSHVVDSDVENLGNKIHMLSQFAEAMSFQTCEECGRPGELRTDGPYRVRCNDCYEKPIDKAREMLDTRNNG